MADKEQQTEERKPLLADEVESQPAASQEKSLEDLYPSIPPPPYEPQLTKPVAPAAPPPTTMFPPPQPAMPLPTYAQSEKYEKDGVLEYTNRDDGMVRIVVSNQPLREQSFGSSLEFTLFFLGCFFFSWFGYLIACCLASTVAAQSGAAAGLGLSLIIKVVYFEFNPLAFSRMVGSLCAPYQHYAVHEHELCMTRYYTLLRIMFWVFAFFGLFLFARGLALFCRTRTPAQQNINTNNSNN